MEKLLNIGESFAQNSFKSKLKIIAKFGHTFGILGKPLWIAFNEGDFFKTKGVWVIFIIERFIK